MQNKLYPDGTKECSRCGLTKPITDFYVVSRKSGPSPDSSCKPCQSEKSRAYQRANPSRRNEARNSKRRADPLSRKLEIIGDHARERALAAQVAYERVDLRAILERDAWVCQICFEPVTLATLSFDHTVPIGRGGAHTASNVRTAHRRCNSKKGMRLPDEPPAAAKRGRRYPIYRVVTCPQCDHQFMPAKTKSPPKVH